MDFLKQFIFLVLVGGSYGLECHDCLYYDGFPDGTFPTVSDPDCDKNPKDAVVCSLPEAIDLQQSQSGNHSVKLSGEMKWACGQQKTEGQGSKFVFRGCVYVSVAQEDECHSWTDLVDGGTLLQDNCYCSENLCNNGNFLEPESPQQTTPAAGGITIPTSSVVFGFMMIPLLIQ